MIKRFVCNGSLNVDLSFPVERLPEEHEKLRCAETRLSFGGSAANTAYWLARLGMEVSMLGCVGDDPFGELATGDLAGAGVDVGLIQHSRQTLTGMAAIFFSPTAKRMVTSGGANANFDVARIPDEIFDPGVHLHVATPFKQFAMPLILMAKRRGSTVSCDLDGGPDPEMIPRLDIVFMNHTDLHRWHGANDARQARGRLEPQTCLVVTQGKDGAILLGPDGEFTHTAFAVNVVDRTGGGDAFDAGFLYALAKGQDPASCLGEGLRLAARVIADQGCRPASVSCTEIASQARNDN